MIYHPEENSDLEMPNLSAENHSSRIYLPAYYHVDNIVVTWPSPLEPSASAQETQPCSSGASANISPREELLATCWKDISEREARVKKIEEILSQERNRISIEQGQSHRKRAELEEIIDQFRREEMTSQRTESYTRLPFGWDSFSKSTDSEDSFDKTWG
jgi:hypothetical protein